MNTDAPTPYTKPQPVRIVQAIIAAISVIATALGAISWADRPSWPTVLVTLVPALSAAYAAYQAVMLPQKVVPVQDTVSYIDETGTEVAGPSSSLPIGQPVAQQPKSEPAPLPMAPTDDTPQPVTEQPKAPGE